MKKPKICNDITNIFAKLCSSVDYDPRVRYDTSLEYYANQVPVLPKPNVGDNKKAVVVKSDGSYELKSVETTAADIVTATAQMTAQQIADTRHNIGAEIEKFVIIVSYDNEEEMYVADKSFSDIEAAYNAGKILQCYLAPDAVLHSLVYLESDASAIFISIVPDIDENGSVCSQLSVIVFDSPTDCSVEQYKYLPEPAIFTNLSSTNVTLSAQANVVYKYGTLSTLNISSFPATGKFWIWFTSGATPTTTTGIANFTAEANKLYKITVEDGYATYDSWPTS